MGGAIHRASARSPTVLLAALPLVAWAVALACTWAPPSPQAAGAVLGAAALLALLGVGRSGGSPRLAALAVVVAVGGLVGMSGAIHSAVRHPSALEDGMRVRAVVEVTAQPVRSAQHSFGSSRVAAVMVSADPVGGSGPVRVTAPVLVFGDLVPQPLGSARTGSPAVAGDAVPAPPAGGAASLDAVTIGARFSIDATLVESENAEDTAWLLVSVSRPQALAAPPAVIGWAGEMRSGFSAWSTGLPGDGGDLLPGLAIGDDSGVPQDLDEAMVAASLSHLTAVSGANCALVVAGAVGALALLGAGLRLRLLGGAVALTGFVVLVTPQPSVLRAAVMAAAVLVATLTGRRRGGTAALGLAVVTLLVLDPWLSRDLGFALSAAATAGLLLLAAPLGAALARVIPQPIALAIAIPAAAQLACQPVLILLEPSLPLLSVPANLLAAPAAPLATVLGLLACLALPMIPALGQALGTVGWAPSAWIAAVARFFSASPADLPWVPGLLGALLLALAAVLLGVGLVRRSAAAIAAGAAVVLLVVAGLAGAAAGRTATLPPDWRFAACDVGQGAATLVRGGSDTFALIDTGDDPQLLDACLDLFGVERIDLLVLTHFDRDHIGAAPSLVGRVDRLVVGPSDGEEADALVADLERGGAEVFHPVMGAHGALGDIAWRVLWPPQTIEPGNDASVVLDLRAPETSAIALGDLGAEAQERMLRLADPRPVVVVGVAHHGSADQSPRLYERLSADVALVSVGASNTYGHPAPSLLTMLESLGEHLERTDRVGSVAVTGGTDGDAASVWTERGEGDERVGGAG